MAANGQLHCRCWLAWAILDDGRRARQATVVYRTIVYRTIEARPCDQCCSGRAMSITHCQARIYARAPGARAQGGKFSGAAY